MLDFCDSTLVIHIIQIVTEDTLETQLTMNADLVYQEHTVTL